MISSRWRDDRTTARLLSPDASASSERVQLVHERATCQVGDRAGVFSVDGSTLDGAAIGSTITQSAVLRERPARVASVHGLGRCASQATTASAAPAESRASVALTRSSRGRMGRTGVDVQPAPGPTLTLRSCRREGGFALATEVLTRALDEAGARYRLSPHAHTESAVVHGGCARPRPGRRREDIRSDDSRRLRAGGAPHLGADRPTQAARGPRRRQDECPPRIRRGPRADHPEFDLGAVPPIGGSRRDPVIIDSRLAERDSLVPEAGSHEESVRVPTGDLLRVSEAEIADIRVDS